MEAIVHGVNGQHATKPAEVEYKKEREHVITHYQVQMERIAIAKVLPVKQDNVIHSHVKVLN